MLFVNRPIFKRHTDIETQNYAKSKLKDTLRHMSTCMKHLDAKEINNGFTFTDKKGRSVNVMYTSKMDADKNAKIKVSRSRDGHSKNIWISTKDVMRYVDIQKTLSDFFNDSDTTNINIYR